MVVFLLGYSATRLLGYSATRLLGYSGQYSKARTFWRAQSTALRLRGFFPDFLPPSHFPLSAERIFLNGLAIAHHTLMRLPPGFKILVVDDALDIQFILDLILKEWGAEVLAASGGGTAIQLALREKPDLLLIDMQLRDMNGLSVLKNLRERAFSAPAIAMTAAPATDVRESCLASGFSGFLAKPINLAVLFQAISAAAALG